MNKLVSILIPAYNAEQWLAGTIESALAQTWPQKEIIVVDDGSTDNTLSVARRYESGVVKVIHQDNRGQSASENVAFAASQGDFIEYLDADDLLAPDKIERQVRMLEESDGNYIASCAWARFYDSPKDGVFIEEPVWRSMGPAEWLISSWGDGGMMHGAAWLVPRVIAEEAGPWNEDLSLIDDFEFFARIILSSAGVLFCPEARTYYRSGGLTRLSASKSRRALESAFKSTVLGTGHLLEHIDSPESRRSCASAFQRFVYSSYPDCPDLIDLAEARVKELGGSPARPGGTPLFRLVSSAVGWKGATRFQRGLYRLGYDKVSPGRYAFKVWRRLKSSRHWSGLPAD